MFLQENLQEKVQEITKNMEQTGRRKGGGYDTSGSMAVMDPNKKGANAGDGLEGPEKRKKRMTT